MFDFSSIKEILSASSSQYILVSNPEKKGLKKNKFQKIKLSNLISALGIPTNTDPYTIYSALITQSGTAAPSATVLQNTLGGTITWARSSTGFYTGTLTGAFTAGKTFLLMQKPFLSNEAGGVYVSKDTAIKRVDNNTIGLYSAAFDNVAKTSVLADTILNAVAIEIRIYI